MKDILKNAGGGSLEAKRGSDGAERVRDFIPEGNVQRVMIKGDHGSTFMEIPLSVATLLVSAAPLLASVGAVVTLISHFSLVVPRADRENESADIQKTEPESPEVSGSGDTPPEDEATTEAEWESEGGASK